MPIQHSRLKIVSLGFLIRAAFHHAGRCELLHGNTKSTPPAFSATDSKSRHGKPWPLLRNVVRASRPVPQIPNVVRASRPVPKFPTWNWPPGPYPNSFGRFWVVHSNSATWFPFVKIRPWRAAELGPAARPEQVSCSAFAFRITKSKTVELHANGEPKRTPTRNDHSVLAG